MTEVALKVQPIQSTDKKLQPKVSHIQKASKLVDSVADLLCDQLKKGQFRIQQQQKPLKIKQQLKDTIQENQQLLKSQSKIKGTKRSVSVLNTTVDIDEHKKMIKKFMKMNKKNRRNQQLRSVQIQQKSKQYLLTLQKSRQQQRNKTLQLRRSQIQRRMSQKQILLKQIQQQMFQRHQRVKSIKAKKFLYQQKEEEYQKKHVLPKLQQEHSIIMKKRQLSKPMNMSQIILHEKKYNQNLTNNRINRLMNSRMIAQQWNYKPPQFVPKSYIILQQERQLQKAEQQIKSKQGLYNQIKKKQFLQALEEQRQLERQKLLQNHKKQIKQSVKPLKVELSRQAKKILGNQYMKQYLKTIDKSKIKQKNWPGMIEQQQKKAKLSLNKKIHTKYELQLIKQERIEKIQKIRFKRIQQIANDKNFSNYQKCQKLAQQSQRLDKTVSERKIHANNYLDRDQSASLILNSIHAKLAMLQISQRNCNNQNQSQI